ncbi:hypothetical protein [Psychroflexus sp. MBR-150]|jgi:hypothetical protein
MVKLAFIILSLFWTYSSLAHKSFNKDPNVVFKEMLQELEDIHKVYSIQKHKIHLNIQQIDSQLKISDDTEQKVELLIQKDVLKTKLQKLKIDNAKDITKIRYIKGLEIIRLLYEKVLSLDHHFASVATFSEINKIANPNQYPEYDRLKSLVKSKRHKKEGFDLTNVLGTNTLVSVINTFSNMMVSDLSKEEKENELKNIDCILDFTLRMQNDLNTIYFETAFLQKSNATIKDDIEKLFLNFTKPIGYAAQLEDCRNNDDWASVRQKLNTFVEQMNKANDSDGLRMRIDLEFPIDRLIQFITQYNNFINDGEDFYQKFKIMLNSYENEDQCQSKLPIEYKKLKSDIDIAVQKFNVAYKPIQVNGSKMKQLLYGLNEYE